VAIVFGLVGYLMKKFGFEPGPLVLAFVLGSLMEPSVRQSLRISGGDPPASSCARSRVASSP
jgi:putative tricarboxylic transport membrane protein